MRLSVVIPTWCEATTVAACVRRAAQLGDEVVVADAASTDGTGERARASGARVVLAPRGRGPQLDVGARAATGDVLLFLHADTYLGAGARDAIDAALRDPAIVGGNFRLRFEPGGSWASLFAAANDLRRLAFRVYYGDSAIFVRRRAYDLLGGFGDLPLMEDYAFVRRLERLGPTAYLRDVAAVSSARRFEGRPLRTLALWALVQGLYEAGVPTPWLAKLYRDLR
ncbi:MAG: glycosyltransferase family 2 protein [Myxococcota bacterium]